jgi:hypothetical protein
MSSPSAELIYDISDKYALYSGIGISIIGLISNIFLILIFVTNRKFRNNQCVFFLSVESIANICLFLSIFSTDLFIYITGYNPAANSTIWCKLLTTIKQACGLCSLFSICFVTFDQFLSTNSRHNWRKISTYKLAYRLTFFNFLLLIPHGVLTLIYTESSLSEGCTAFNPTFKTYLAYFYDPILLGALPLVTTIAFSLLAFRNVRRIIRRQVPVVRRRLDRQLTAMVLTRVVCLTLLGLPYTIFSLYQLNFSLSGDDQMGAAIVSLVGTIITSLVSLNFAVKYYLFRHFLA